MFFPNVWPKALFVTDLRSKNPYQLSCHFMNLTLLIVSGFKLKGCLKTKSRAHCPCLFMCTRCPYMGCEGVLEIQQFQSFCEQVSWVHQTYCHLELSHLFDGQQRPSGKEDTATIAATRTSATFHLAMLLKVWVSVFIGHKLPTLQICGKA